MAIRTAKAAGTAAILGDARYHLGAVTSRTDTKSHADPVRKGIATLRTRRNTAESDEEGRVEGLGALTRLDFELDRILSKLDGRLLDRVDKDRSSPLYREVVGKDGMARIIALRGKAQLLAVKALFTALAKHAPELHEEYAEETLKLAADAAAAETTYEEATTAAGRSQGEEFIARAEMVRQLQKNEGALQSMFPGQKARVRTFFRARPKKKTEGGETK